MIVLHATFPLDPASRDEALDLIEDLVEQSQQEDGMIDYRAATDIADPNVVRLFEQYEDARSSPVRGRFGDRTRALTGDPQ